MMLRVHSPLDHASERVVRDVIGCCIRVHRSLGPGLLERAYVNALCLELQAMGLSFATERELVVRYRSQVVSTQRVDLVVGDCVVVEVKSVDALARIHHAQILSYLRAGGYRVGLLVNFNTARLVYGLKRMVL